MSASRPPPRKPGSGTVTGCGRRICGPSTRRARRLGAQGAGRDPRRCRRRDDLRGESRCSPGSSTTRPQFRAVAATCAPEVPCLVLQFTSPPVTDYLAVRLHANNALAHRMFAGETPVLCERDFVLALDVLAHGRGRAQPLQPRKMTLNEQAERPARYLYRLRRQGRAPARPASCPPARGSFSWSTARRPRNDYGRSRSCWENRPDPTSRPNRPTRTRGGWRRPEALADLGSQAPDPESWPEVTPAPDCSPRDTPGAT